MFLISLPYELDRLILQYLDLKTTVRLSQVSKGIKATLEFYTVDTWKDRCIIDYKYNFQEKPEVIPNYFIFYKKLYDTRCVKCFVITKRVEYFTGQRACWKCQSNVKYPEYHKISKTRAMKEYYLREKDLENLKTETRQNPFSGGFRPMKLYLVSDVVKASQERNKKSLEELEKIKENKRFTRQLKKQVKFTLLQEMLSKYYGLNLSRYVLVINGYSRGLYFRYINNIGKFNEELTLELLNKILELDYILKSEEYGEITAEDVQDISVQDFLPIPDCTYFESYLLHQLLTDTYENSNYAYIKALVIKIMNKYPDKFYRKMEIINYFGSNEGNGFEYSLLDFKIMDYIDYGLGNIESIITGYVEDSFIAKYFTITQLISRSILEGISISKLHKQVIIEKYKDGVEIPDRLYQKYIRDCIVD